MESLSGRIALADLIIVGSGFYGLTVAEQAANDGYRVSIIEARNHIGGNAYSFLDDKTGIEIHKYGSHLFHTSNVSVFEYISKFTDLNNYRHKVVAKHNERFFPIPINLFTLSQFYGRTFTPNDAKELFESFGNFDSDDLSLEDFAIKNLGKPLYEAFFKNYTLKQWGIDPKSLPAATIKRIPIRTTFEDQYFNDIYQGLPVNGYQSWFNSMISNPLIEVFTNVDFFDLPKHIYSGKAVCFTGPLDRYFNFKLGRLGWRTLDFEIEKLEELDFQGTSVVNYVDLDEKFTRIHEFKHLHPEREYQNQPTIIMKEFSRLALQGDEPYYPVNSTEDREKLLGYRELAKNVPLVFFGGRLGTYQYLDMHMAIGSALTNYRNQILPVLRSQN
jgi:UDP-galactopyranose mutase